MTDLRQHLQADDPLAHDPALAPADAERILRAVLNAPAAQPAAMTAGGLALAAGLAVAVTAGVWLVRTVPPAPPAGVDPAWSVNDESARYPARRQLQFATPGGTRVIWVFETNDNRGESQ